MIDRSLEGFPPSIIDELNAILSVLPPVVHEHLLELTEEVVALSCPAAAEFVKSYPLVTERAGLTGLEYWFREGLELLQKRLAELKNVKYPHPTVIEEIEKLEAKIVEIAGMSEKEKSDKDEKGKGSNKNKNKKDK